MDDLLAELQRWGSLRDWLQFHLETMGSGVVLEANASAASEGVIPVWAYAVTETRVSQIGALPRQQLYRVDFWDRGVCLGVGTIASIEEVARMVDAWVGRDIEPLELKALFPAVKLEDGFEAYVAGAEAFVEWQWLELKRKARQFNFLVALAPAIEMAYLEPALRQLSPRHYGSGLYLSRCTGDPALLVYPCIVAVSKPRVVKDGGEAKYVVRDREKTPLMAGNAAAVVEFVVSRLPADIGPAFLGAGVRVE